VTPSRRKAVARPGWGDRGIAPVNGRDAGEPPENVRIVHPVPHPSVRFVYRGRSFDLAGAHDRDHIFRKIRDLRTFYEIDLLEYIARVVTAKGGVAIDAGANIGNHSVFFGAVVGSQVISVEPNGNVISVLERNLKTNLGVSHVLHCALGAAAGSGVVVGGPANVGGARVVTPVEAAEAPDKLGTTTIRTLDSVVANEVACLSPRARITLIKIDVEGMEAEVLAGAQETLRAHHPHLFIEAGTSKHLTTLRALLEPLGYRSISKWAATPVYHFVHEPSLRLRLEARLLSYLRLSRIVRQGRHTVTRVLRERPRWHSSAREL